MAGWLQEFRGAPLRFIFFLMLLAGLLIYLDLNWESFQSETSGLPEKAADATISSRAGMGEGGPAGALGSVTDRVDSPSSMGNEGSSERQDVQPTDPDEEGAPTTGLSSIRLRRDQARSQERDVLERLRTQSATDGTASPEAEQALVEFAQRERKEAEAESLLAARGFKDGLVFLYPANAVVMVGTDLDPVKAARVADTVSQVTGLPPENVSIMEVRD